MLVRLKIWFEIASKVCGVRTSAVEPFVTFDRGASTSLVAMFWRASIVADCGGVFSPRILCGGRLKDGRTVSSRFGVSRPGVGVTDRLESFSGGLSADFSGDLGSSTKSLFECGVAGRPELFSGDRGVLNVEPPSKKLLKSLTFPV
tara:strand:- start:396 stop:833 length:438 start_codon:yes stop_codon:yes gene_type:complete